MYGGLSLLERKRRVLYELYVCILNESIDGFLAHRSRDFYEEQSKTKRNFRLQKKRADSFSFLHIIPSSTPSVPNYLRAAASSASFLDCRFFKLTLK